MIRKGFTALFFLSLASCTSGLSADTVAPDLTNTPIPATEAPPETVAPDPTNTSIPATEAMPESTWPEDFHFCRPKGDGTSDCWNIKNADEWLALEPVSGERIPIWPENMPLPPLPEGLGWEYIRDASIGEYFWTIVEIE